MKIFFLLMLISLQTLSQGLSERLKEIYRINYLIYTSLQSTEVVEHKKNAGNPDSSLHLHYALFRISPELKKEVLSKPSPAKKYSALWKSEIGNRLREILISNNIKAYQSLQFSYNDDFSKGMVVFLAEKEIEGTNIASFPVSYVDLSFLVEGDNRTQGFESEKRRIRAEEFIKRNSFRNDMKWARIGDLSLTRTTLNHLKSIFPKFLVKRPSVRMGFNLNGRETFFVYVSELNERDLKLVARSSSCFDFMGDF